MTHGKSVRIVAGIAAAVGWLALALQFVLLTRLLGAGLGTWRFVGFFTILSNIAIAVIASAIAAGADNRLTRARARLMGLTAIVTVGFVYSLLLRSLWNPVGWNKVADAALHDVTPLLFVMLWAVMPHGELRWRDLGWALAGPALYLAYALGRGSVDGWYPYYFLDPTTQSGASLAASIAGVIIVFAVIGASAIALDRRLAGRERALVGRAAETIRG